jgi:tetratricopeptide (TPR) repeat protein
MQAQAAAQTKSIPPSRYEQINKGIDDYLTARKLGNLAEANQILEDVSSVASEMASMTGDKFGMDVVSYYRGVPNNAIEELQKARKLRAEVEATIPSDNYDSSLAKLGKAKSTFEELGAQIDIETTNIQIVRNLTNANRLQEAEPLAKTGLDNAVKSTHIFSQSSWLYWKGQIFYRSSRRDMAIPIFEQSQQIANTLGVIDLELHPARALADIYYEQNDNVRALQQSRDCLPLAILVNNRFLEFQFTQIAGMSLLSLNDKEGAEKYLQRGLEIA